MATLDVEESLPDKYKAIFRYHSSRPPTDQMVFQLADSLQLARRMSREAAKKVTAVLNGDVTPEKAELVRQVLRHHFRADVSSSTRTQTKIASVLTSTADGLAGHVQLSDVLSRYMWNLYEVYIDGHTWDETRVRLKGEYRKDNPQEPRGGYVEDRTRKEEFLNATRTTVKSGNIHVEFSYAAVYPKMFLAHVIVHEATHKFGGTDDYAYTEEDHYARLRLAERINNADSYAYTVLSLSANVLIKDLNTALQAILRTDPRPARTFVRNEAEEVMVL